jgi:ribosomal protein L7Ae-like RNA K-turn-binding protein
MNRAEARELSVANQWKAVARLVGLGARARGICIGVEAVRKEVARNRVHLVIAASNASANSLQKLVPLLKGRGVTLVVGPEAAELGAAVGRSAVAALGVFDKQLAAGITRAYAVSPGSGQEE